MLNRHQFSLPSLCSFFKLFENTIPESSTDSHKVLFKLHASVPQKKNSPSQATSDILNSMGSLTFGGPLIYRFLPLGDPPYFRVPAPFGFPLSLKRFLSLRPSLTSRPAGSHSSLAPWYSVLTLFDMHHTDFHKGLGHHSLKASIGSGKK